MIIKTNKIYFKLLLFILSFFLFVSVVYSSDVKNTESTKNDGSIPYRYKILCSIFPVYAITKALLENIDIHCDLQFKHRTGCVHAYTLTPKELSEIQNYDFLIVLGDGFESFLSDLQIKNLLPANKTKIIKAGEDFVFNDISFSKNQHIFTIPTGYVWMANKIYNELKYLFSSNANLQNTLAANYENIIKLLNNTQEKYNKAKARLEKQKVILSQPTFGYLTSLLNMEVIDTIQNEEEHMHNHSSFSVIRIKELLEKIRLYNPKFIITSESASDMTVINMLTQDTNIKVVVLNDMINPIYFSKEVESNKLAINTFELVIEKLNNNIDLLLEASHNN